MNEGQETNPSETQKPGGGDSAPQTSEESGSESPIREIQPDSQLLIWVEKADRSDRADKAIESEEIK